MKKAIGLCMALLMIVMCFPVFATGEMVTANENGNTNVAFSNGYYGYCLDRDKRGAYVDGTKFTEANNTSVATSNVDNSDLSHFLKALFTQCFDDIFHHNGEAYVIENDEQNLVQAAIWGKTEGQHIWGDQKKISDKASSYTGPAIPDDGYQIHLDNGDVVTFHFTVLIPEDNDTQYFFAYKLTVTDAEDTPPAHECEFGSDWESDGENHWHECECGEKQDEAEHTPTKADCVTPSVCEICEEELGGVDKDNHVGETELRGYKPAGEFEDGYTGDTYCKSCDGLIKEGEPIPATHVCEFGSDWESDGENHWHECECGEKQDEAEHTPTKADCVTGSVCEICEEELSGVDKGNHTGNEEVRNSKPAEEFEDGYTGDIYCTDCGELIERGEPIPATHECEFGEEWESDEEKHWHECECGEKKDETEHTPTKADCVKGSVCEICEEELSGVDKGNHTGNEEVRNSKPAEEFEDGYTGDIYCKDCDGLIEEGEPIPATHECEFGSDWESDGENHWHECECGERADEGEHEPTKADCVTPSVCEICEEELSGVDKGNHIGETELRGYKPAGEFEDGYTGDTYCKSCDGLIEEGEPIPATHECEFGEEWESDEEKHWHECKCGEVTDLAEHNGNPCADCGAFDESKGEVAPETGDGMDVCLWSSLCALVFARGIADITRRRKRA